jgi:hypothetical protein
MGTSVSRFLRRNRLPRVDSSLTVSRVKVNMRSKREIASADCDFTRKVQNPSSFDDEKMVW